MTIADAERFEREDEYEGCAEREAAANAEVAREIMAPALEAMERAVRELDRRKLLDRYVPGAPTDLGFQPGYIADMEAVVAQVLWEAKGAMTPWIKEDVRALVEG